MHHRGRGEYVEGPREVAEPGGGASEPAAPACPGPTGAVRPSGFFFLALPSPARCWRLGAHSQGSAPPGSESVRRRKELVTQSFFDVRPLLVRKRKRMIYSPPRHHMASSGLGVSLALPSADPSFLFKSHFSHFSFLPRPLQPPLNEFLWFLPKNASLCLDASDTHFPKL